MRILAPAILVLTAIVSGAVVLNSADWCVVDVATLKAGVPPSTTRLKLDGLSSDQISSLKIPDSVTHLDLSGRELRPSMVTPEIVLSLLKLPNLSHLNLSYCPKVDDTVFLGLGEQTDIQELICEDDQAHPNRVSQAGINALKEMINLKALALSLAKPLPAGWLAGMAKISSLKVLSLKDVGSVSLDELAVDGASAELTEFSLGWCRILEAENCQAAFADGGVLSKLEVLSLRYCEREVVEGIVQRLNPGIRHLDVGVWKDSTFFRQYVERSNSIVSLSLCIYQAGGGIDLFPSLSSQKKLASLTIWGIGGGALSLDTVVDVLASMKLQYLKVEVDLDQGVDVADSAFAEIHPPSKMSLRVRSIAEDNQEVLLRFLDKLSLSELMIDKSDISTGVVQAIEQQKLLEKLEVKESQWYAKHMPYLMKHALLGTVVYAHLNHTQKFNLPVTLPLGLRHLDVRGSVQTARGIEGLGTLVDLATLQLTGGWGGDFKKQVFAELPSLLGLTTFEMRSEKDFNKDDARTLSKLPLLADVDVTLSNFDFSMLQVLLEEGTIRSIRCNSTYISEEILHRPIRTETLRYLDISAHRWVTAKTLETLRKKMPDVFVVG
jgi:hypothetical protein